MNNGYPCDSNILKLCKREVSCLIKLNRHSEAITGTKDLHY